MNRRSFLAAPLAFMLPPKPPVPVSGEPIFITGIVGEQVQETEIFELTQRDGQFYLDAYFSVVSGAFESFGKPSA